MTNNLENLGAQRTRRNIVKAGPILASAIAVSLATKRNALAKDNDNDNGNGNGKTLATDAGPLRQAKAAIDARGKAHPAAK